MPLKSAFGVESGSIIKVLVFPPTFCESFWFLRKRTEHRTVEKKMNWRSNALHVSYIHISHGKKLTTIKIIAFAAMKYLQVQRTQKRNRLIDLIEDRIFFF